MGKKFRLWADILLKYGEVRSWSTIYFGKSLPSLNFIAIRMAITLGAVLLGLFGVGKYGFDASYGNIPYFSLITELLFLISYITYYLLQGVLAFQY